MRSDSDNFLLKSGPWINTASSGISTDCNNTAASAPAGLSFELLDCAMSGVVDKEKRNKKKQFTKAAATKAGYTDVRIECHWYIELVKLDDMQNKDYVQTMNRKGIK